MNLDLSPDQRLIRDEAARFLTERSSSEDVRKVIDRGTGFDRDLWNAVSRELGWCGLVVPEAYGGIGLGWTEATILLELSGARLACLPLWSTLCVSVPLLLSAAREEAKEEFLAAIASGEKTVVTVLPSVGSSQPFDDVAVKAVEEGGGYRLAGRIAIVLDAASADILLVPALLDDASLGLFAVSAETLGITPLKVLDPTGSMASVTVADVVVDAQARIDSAGLLRETREFVTALADLGLAALEIGAARGAMDMTLAYIGQRVQFGRTIASFQAIKHRCAKLEIDMAEARSLLYGAAAGVSLETGTIDRLEAAGVRVLSSDLAFRSAEEAIQLHGGVGFTWEYDPHLYFKRAQASSAQLGAVDHRLDLIAAAVMGDAA